MVFGTSIRIDFKLIPLLKGLRIGQITSQLIESHDLTLNPDEPDSTRNTYKITRTILTDEHEINEDNIEVIDEAAEGYQFTRYLDMPQTLKRCLQDTDTKGIKIRHKMKFRIQLHNPDGHVSEVSGWIASVAQILGARAYPEDIATRNVTRLHLYLSGRPAG